MFDGNEIVLGLWSVGGDWGPVDALQARDLIIGARDLEVHWVDTAPIYGRGNSDELLATALEQLGADAPKIATKVGPRFEGDHPVCDLSDVSIRADLEASLGRLGVERVDLVQAHWPCEKGTPLAETVATLEALVTEGKAAAWGLCNYGADALATAKPASMQSPYSMMRRELEHEGLPAACLDASVPILAYETLGRGLLSGKFTTLPRFASGDFRRQDPRFWGPRFMRTAASVGLLRQVSERFALPCAALATGWVLAQPSVGGVIVGARRIEQLRETVQARVVAKRPEVVRLLDRVSATFR